MSINGTAFVAGAFEHPRREIVDRSVSQIHAEVAVGALRDAGLALSDVDAFFCDGKTGFGGVSLADYLGLKLSYIDSTQTGGSSYIVHLGHAAAAIAAGKCQVALITLAGRPRTERQAEPSLTEAPEYSFETVYGLTTANDYALAARRHMYEYGTTGAQLAEVKVAASHHAQYNEQALLRDKVSVEEVLESPMIADPLHRLDCCVITDGGGALVVVSPEIARQLPRHCVKIMGSGEATKHTMNGRLDLTFSGAAWAGPAAFREAGVTPSDVDYASIYDSFTFTVIQAVEDLGFCEKGHGGRFVADGGLISPGGRLPFNTDGGGLCNNHPANHGGMTKVIEAVRQLRGEAHPAVQVPDCEIALAYGSGGRISTRMVSAAVVLGRQDA